MRTATCDKLLPMRRLLLFALLTLPAAAQQAQWTGTWAASPVANPNTSAAAGKSDQTLRQTVHLSLGGDEFRITFTNEFGTDPLTIGAATARQTLAGATTATPAAAPLTFSGQPTATIAPGATLTSDPVFLKVPALSDLTIQLFLPAQTISVITQHSSAYTSNAILPGNQIANPTADPGKDLNNWRFLKHVEVITTDGARSIVAFGDSITDGAQSTRDGNNRWPDVLARRLAANASTGNVGVLNQGIGGNRILHDGTGPSALARFDRDVLEQPNARYLIVLEGINDIGHSNPKSKIYDPISAADLIAALRYIIERAHAHGLKVYGATLTPFGGSGSYSPEGEAIRQAENAFIRSGAFDAVIDFDKATRDPAKPNTFLPAYDSGDHLHPKDAGYKAMGDSIDLTLFTK